MYKSFKTFSAALISAVFAAPSAFASDMFVFSVSDDTPASFFSSGIEGYYFSSKGVGTLRYDGDRLLHKVEPVASSEAAADSEGENLFRWAREMEVMLDPTGAVRLVRPDGSYACPSNHLLNCLYSDVIINAINVRNLTGKVDIAQIGSYVSVKRGDELNFGLGSKIYSFNAVLPPFDFDSFDDFDSLICSKSETGGCRAAVSEGVLDKAALFELYQGEGELEGVMFGYAGEGLIYVFNLREDTAVPYDASCAQEARAWEELDACALKSMPEGKITERRHPSGLVYWLLDYGDPKLDNEIFWINGRGEPFKVYINPARSMTFSIFNKTAAEVVSKAMQPFL